MKASVSFTIATWNIGAGILGDSHQRGGEIMLDYYIDLITQHAPDIICLQEAHDYGDQREGQSQHIARHAGYEHVSSFPISPSHLESDASLSLGILSRFPMKDLSYTQFPNPGLTSTGPTGESWTLFDKGYAKGLVDIDGTIVSVVNAHCFPLHYFAAAPTEDRFTSMWRMLADDLMAGKSWDAMTAAIDLNWEPIEDVLAPALRPDGYHSALTRTPTTPAGVQQDYLLYDASARLIDATVRPTESDHHYCQISLRV